VLRKSICRERAQALGNVEKVLNALETGCQRRLCRSASRRVGWRVVITAWVLALMVGCTYGVAGPTANDGRAGADTPPKFLFGTTWFVEQIDADDIIDGVGPLLVIRSAGHATGSGGCNSFSGPVTINGDAITFGALATTKMACTPALMNQEQKFFAALAATRSYRTRGPYLMLYDAAGTVRVKLIARVRM
jgi:heat shock protein HslJ